MRGIKAEIDKLKLAVKQFLLAPKQKPSQHVYDVNFYSFSQQAIQLAQIVFKNSEIEEFLVQGYEDLAATLKKASKARPLEDDSGEEQFGATDEISKFLNTRKPITEAKQRGQLQKFLTEMQQKQKDHDDFLDSINKVKPNLSREKGNQKKEHQTQTEITWLAEDPKTQKGTNLLLPKRVQYRKQTNHQEQMVSKNFLQRQQDAEEISDNNKSNKGIIGSNKSKIYHNKTNLPKNQSTDHDLVSRKTEKSIKERKEDRREKERSLPNYIAKQKKNLHSTDAKDSSGKSFLVKKSKKMIQFNKSGQASENPISELTEKKTVSILEEKEVRSEKKHHSRKKITSSHAGALQQEEEAQYEVNGHQRRNKSSEDQKQLQSRGGKWSRKKEEEGQEKMEYKSEKQREFFNNREVKRQKSDEIKNKLEKITSKSKIFSNNDPILTKKDSTENLINKASNKIITQGNKETFKNDQQKGDLPVKNVPSRSSPHSKIVEQPIQALGERTSYNPSENYPMGSSKKESPTNIMQSSHFSKQSSQKENGRSWLPNLKPQQARNSHANFKKERGGNLENRRFQKNTIYNDSSSLHASQNSSYDAPRQSHNFSKKIHIDFKQQDQNELEQNLDGITEQQLLKKDEEVVERLRALKKLRCSVGDASLNLKQIQYFVEVIVRRHQKKCGKHCIHLNRFYRFLSKQKIRVQRKQLLLAKQMIGGGNFI